MNKIVRLIACVVALGGSALAAPEYETDLNKAIESATAEKKMMFIFYGREGCGICRTTKAMVKSRDIRLSPSKYVQVDINCDDPKLSAGFNKRYSNQKFGKTLPFVVIADSAGNALASASGYKDGREWGRILKEAEKKASVPSDTKAPDSNWPFKTAPKAGQ